MAEISITPGELRSVAATFKQKSAESTQMISQLEGQVSSMQPSFRGMTSEKFYNDFTEWRSQMKHFTQLLDGIATELEHIATKFEETDRTH